MITASNPATQQFGVHLLLDGYQADSEALADQTLLRQLLMTLPEQLSMHTICEPTVLEVGPMNQKDPGGVSGFVMIAESHISFHTFPARQFVTIDVYTCQDTLDTKTIQGIFTSALGCIDWDVQVLPRGQRYPRHDIIT